MPAAKSPKKPRIGAHTPTTGGMAKRSIAYAETIAAEAIQVFKGIKVFKVIKDYKG